VDDIARMPALTRAEADVVDSYSAVLEHLSRINPARQDETYGALRAAQALVAEATALRDALALMFERGETTFHSTTLVRALRVLDADKRIDRIGLSPVPPG
jgi:hypothetical protein